MNLAFKHFVTKNFSSKVAYNLEKLSKQHEYNELYTENEREEKKVSNCNKGFSFICCWIPNKRNSTGESNTTFDKKQITS